MPGISHEVRTDLAQRHGDAFDIQVFENALTEYQTAAIMQKLVPLQGMSYWPVIAAPRGAEKHSYGLFHGTGKAAWRAPNDLHPPIVDVGGARDELPFREFWVGYRLSDDDMKKLAFAQSNGHGAMADVDAMKPIVARRASMEKLDKAIWDGDAESGIYGALNFPGVPHLYPSTTFAPGTTPTDMLAALHDLVDSVAENSGEIENPVRLGLSPRINRLISRTRLSTDSTDTVKTAFLKENRYITQESQIVDVIRFKDGDLDGFDYACVDNGDPLSMAHRLQYFAEEREMLKVGHGQYEVPMYTGTGGMVSQFPKGVTIAHLTYSAT